MKQVIRYLDGLVLTLVGLCAGWFAVWGDYWLLMNPGFCWLTTSGAVLVTVLGLTIMVYSPPSPNYSGIVFFIVLFLIVFFGRPYSIATSPTAKMMNPYMMKTPPPAESGPAKTKISELYYATIQEVETDYSNTPFRVIGMVKRLPELDQAGYFALMEYVMFCCAADAMALGFPVRHDKTLELADGDWVEITGRLKKLNPPITIPIFRFLSAAFTTVNDAYVIEPERIKIIRIKKEGLR